MRTTSDIWQKNATICRYVQNGSSTSSDLLIFRAFKSALTLTIMEVSSRRSMTSWKMNIPRQTRSTLLFLQ